MKMFPPTTSRVEANTPESLNIEIEENTIRDLARLMHDGPKAISKRLEELDREWDIERALEANAATASLIGLGLGFKADRRWFVLPVVVAGFSFNTLFKGGVRQCQSCGNWVFGPLPKSTLKEQPCGYLEAILECWRTSRWMLSEWLKAMKWRTRLDVLTKAWSRMNVHQAAHRG